MFEKYILDVPDFPKPGIVFKDITPLLKNPEAFSNMIEALCERAPVECETLIGIESRGFILASAMAVKMNKGFVLARKPGKLPRKTTSQTYELEYGTDSIEIQEGDIKANEKVLIVDDVLATGGTAAAVESLCRKLEAELLGSIFLMELRFLKGGAKIQAPYQSLIQF